MEMKNKIIIGIASVAVILFLVLFLRSFINDEEDDPIKNTLKTKFTLGSANLKGEFADYQFSVLNQLSHYAFCSIQELRIEKSEWTTPKLGQAEIFKPNMERHPFLFVMLANADVGYNGTEYFHSCGIYINPNSGFQFTNYSVHHIKGAEEKGIILVFGKFGENDFVFGGIHGDWDTENGGYDNKINIDGVTRALEEISKKKTKYYVIMGDFNIKYSVMTAYLKNKWSKILPDITLEEGPRFTCFDIDGLANPDHILTNIPYKNLEYFFRGGDHLHISLDIELDDFKKRKSDLISLGENE